MMPPEESQQQEEPGTQNEIISLVAHELKNPLVSIRGYAEILLTGAAGDVNQQQAGFLRTIMNNTERMAELINDLLDASKLDTGRVKVVVTQVDATLILKEVIADLLPQLEEKGLLLLTNGFEDLPPVQADGSRLAQIFINLLSNAAKYTLPGGKITIGAQHIDDEVVFSVTDTGIGIKKEDQKRIFQRYYRTEDVQLRDIPGTGLGLYITKRLVELQQGRIWFESTYNQGTTFFFSLSTAETN